eukprot:Amastigsp_a680587_62.p2 type:complete len:194 gc:universal Amastigsp_a680587_62:904-323(-)
MVGIDSPKNTLEFAATARMRSISRNDGVSSSAFASASHLRRYSSASACAACCARNMEFSMLEILAAASFSKMSCAIRTFETSATLAASSSARFFSVSSCLMTTRCRCSAISNLVFSLSISSRFCLIFSGILGFVTRTAMMSMPGAHTLFHSCSAVAKRSSTSENLSTNTSWSEWLEQNWLISWWILSKMHDLS